MKIKNIFVATIFSITMLPAMSVMAEPKFPDTMTMAEALSSTIAQVTKSDYKEIEITTKGGTVSGEFVKQAGTVLILKRNTGNTNLKHNKDKYQYFIVDANSVTGISFYALD